MQARFRFRWFILLTVSFTLSGSRADEGQIAQAVTNRPPVVHARFFDGETQLSFRTPFGTLECVWSLPSPRLSIRITAASTNKPLVLDDFTSEASPLEQQTGAVPADDVASILRDAAYELSSDFCWFAGVLHHGSFTESLAIVALPTGVNAIIRRYTAVVPTPPLRFRMSISAAPEVILDVRTAKKPFSLAADGRPTPDLGSWLHVQDSVALLAAGPQTWNAFRFGEKRVVFESVQKSEAAQAHEVLAQQVCVIAPGRNFEQAGRLARAFQREGDLQTSRVLFDLEGWLINVNFDTPLPEVTVRSPKPRSEKTHEQP
jgi:hypothetical protein